MKITRSFLALPVVLALSASATTIPPDLEAHAAELRKQASPQMLAWAHDQGVALARAHGPIDLGALEQSVRSRFVVKGAPPGHSSASRGTAITSTSAVYPNLGSLADADVMAICFIVMMEATKSAQEDLKAIMDGVKLINKQKDALRTIQDTVNKETASLATTSPAANPTPAPDRVAELVSAARSIQSKTFGARLAAMAWR